MAKEYVMALDAGTTSNRAIIFDKNSKIVGVAQREFTQHFPKPGWVEHDADEIWSTMVAVMKEALEHRHNQSARNNRYLGQENRSPDLQRYRLAIASNGSYR